MVRKPKVSKQDAVTIAVRHATANGVTVTGAADVHSPTNDGTWSIFVPSDSKFEPCGVVVIVDQDSGEARMLPTF